jgi:putative methyltransferase (TIGR04325 family)
VFFEDKVEDINRRISLIDHNSKVAIWCAGVHTERLLSYSNMLELNINFIIDVKPERYINHKTFGLDILKPDNVNFDTVDTVVISSYKYQLEIAKRLSEIGFKGDVVKLYSESDGGEFYNLPRKDNQSFYFMGHFDNWQEARACATGYDEDSIAQKVLEASKAVMRGEARYERDSVLFNDLQYNFRIVSAFGLVASRRNQVNILDFGGALGSEYWRNRNMLYAFNTKFTWNVVEQDNYVRLGNQEVGNDELFFYKNVRQVDCPIDIVLLSSVLQYLPSWKSILKDIADLKPKYILIERQPISSEQGICVQYVGDLIYKASYPMWLITEHELMACMDSYEVVSISDGDIDMGNYYVDGHVFTYKNYFMKRG